MNNIGNNKKQINEIIQNKLENKTNINEIKKTWTWKQPTKKQTEQYDIRNTTHTISKIKKDKTTNEHTKTQTEN